MIKKPEWKGGTYTNADRAHAGAWLVEKYASIPGMDAECAFRDLLADLMHYADREGIDFWAEVEAADRHHLAEVTGEE